jgi:hypothetical protein
MKDGRVETFKYVTIGAPFFDHMIQGLCICYLPNIKSKWNKFK